MITEWDVVRDRHTAADIATKAVNTAENRGTGNIAISSRYRRAKMFSRSVTNIDVFQETLHIDLIGVQRQ